MKKLNFKQYHNENTPTTNNQVLNVHKSYLLFPTIERMKQTPAGRFTWIQVDYEICNGIFIIFFIINKTPITIIVIIILGSLFCNNTLLDKCNAQYSTKKCQRVFSVSTRLKVIWIIPGSYGFCQLRQCSNFILYGLYIAASSKRARS